MAAEKSLENSKALLLLYSFAKALVAFQGKKCQMYYIFVGNSTRLLHA